MKKAPVSLQKDIVRRTDAWEEALENGRPVSRSADFIRRWAEPEGAAQAAVRRLLLGGPFFAALFILAALFVLTEAEVAGVVVFAFIVSALLVVSGDLLTVLMPLLLASEFVTHCYDSYSTFIGYIWLLVPLVAAAVWHFAVYRRPVRLGKSFWGIVAVAVAVTLGGLGTLSAADYFTPASLYYVGGLGVGMVILYLLMKSRCVTHHDVDIRERFAVILYCMGLFACFMVLRIYAVNWEALQAAESIEDVITPQVLSSNNLSTFLMLALPIPFYFARKHEWHLAVGLLFYACTILTTSRGGALMGGVELFACLVYICFINRKKRAFNIVMACVVLGCCLLFLKPFLTEIGVLTSRGFVSRKEMRFAMLFRAWDDFLAAPLFGRGIGYQGNTDIYSPKTFAMNWYHMMVPQIIGSLGLAGVAAYGFQIWGRARMILRQTTPYGWALGLSYLGILLMSQINPGEFCPIPFELITVLLFVFLELPAEPAPARRLS